jgi:dolichol kinase
MTRLPVQRTRFQDLLSRLGAGVAGQVRRSWRNASMAALALLLGFFAGQNLTSYVLFSYPGGRPAVVLALLLLIETLVRLRSRLAGAEPSLGWVIVDNLRIGVTYAIVLEAFKVGT